MIQASQVTARVNLLFMVDSARPLGVLLKGDYSAAVFSLPVYPRGSTVAEFTLAEGSGLTATLRANVYYNETTGDIRYTNPGGYTDLGQYTEVLINPTEGQRDNLIIRHEYALRADAEPLVSGLISAKLYGGEAGGGCASSPDLDVLLAPDQDLVVLVGMPAPTVVIEAGSDPDLNNTVGDGLTGLVDGVNTVYTLPRVSTKSKTSVYYEGLKTTQFNVAGNQLAMGFAPEMGIPFVVDLF